MDLDESYKISWNNCISIMKNLLNVQLGYGAFDVVGLVTDVFGLVSGLDCLGDGFSFLFNEGLRKHIIVVLFLLTSKYSFYLYPLLGLGHA